MRKNTEEQWKIVEEKLFGCFGMVKLLIDGYEVLLMIHRIGKMQLAIAVYINGQIKGEYLDKGSEESRRFYFLKKRYVMSLKYRQKVKRLSKRVREGLILHEDDVVTYYYPWWTSFKSLRRHLIKNNESIELMEDKA